MVVGYVSLCNTVIPLEAAPPSLAKTKHKELPAQKIARLAVASEYQGRGLGRFLLLYALSVCLGISRDIGSCAVLVDAKDLNGVEFYTKYGFTAFDDKPLSLFMPMKEIEQSLADPGNAYP
jgi:GNAT superfamily N-acetyltransferase